MKDRACLSLLRSVRVPLSFPHSILALLGQTQVERKRGRAALAAIRYQVTPLTSSADKRSDRIRPLPASAWAIGCHQIEVDEPTRARAGGGRARRLARPTRSGSRERCRKRRAAPYISGTKSGWMKVKSWAWREANKNRGELSGSGAHQRRGTVVQANPRLPSMQVQTAMSCSTLHVATLAITRTAPA